MRRNNNDRGRAERKTEDSRDFRKGERSFDKKPFEKGGFKGKSSENKFSNSDRKPFGERKSFGDRKPFEDRGERRSFGDRKPFEDRGERKSFGDRKPFEDRGERRSFGDRKPFEDRGERRSFGDRKPFEGRGERKSFGDRKPFEDRSERKSFGDRKPFEDRGERRSFGDRKPFEDRGERRSFGERKPFEDRGERRSFGDRKPFEDRGERKSFGDRKPFEDRGERKSFGDRKPFEDRGERRSFGDRKLFEERGERRSFGDRKPFEDRGERRSFGDRKPFEGRGERRSFGDRKPFEGRGERRSFGDREERGYGEDNFGKRKFGAKRRADEAFEYGKNLNPGKRPDYSEESLLKRVPEKQKAKFVEKESASDDIRLNRYIANAGLCSRREADDLIESGQITVNGKTVTEMGYQVKTTDVVKYGRKILNREKLVYVLLNKPKDFITTTEDPEGRRTVMELVSKVGPERIYPVGRLDRATTGLLLFTNDGELAEKLSHPSNEIRKIYQVEIDKPITSEDFDKLIEGIELEDGFIKPDALSVITPDQQVIGIEIHSGKNRIVRRLFEAIGYEVTKLDRTTYAGLTKKDLPRGNWRFLSEKEVIRLKYMI